MWYNGEILWWGWILYILFFAMLISIIILTIRNSPTRYRSIYSEETARDILDKRYARGEITKEEFERLKKDLQE